MKKRYLVWKDPACNGRDIEWVEISGEQFVEMMKLPENRKRRFIHLSGDPCGGADTLLIEATEEQYREWRKEYDAAYYRSERDKNIILLSLDMPLVADDEMTMYDLISSGDENVEELVLRSMLAGQVRRLVDSLPEEDRALILAVYADGRTTVQLARERGVSQQAISKRLGRILSLLKKFF